MTEQSLPQLHQSFPQTTPTNNHVRGSVTILSIWWWTITVVGVVAILGCTSRYLDIASARRNADAIALAVASRGTDAAQVLAAAVGVRILAVDEDNGTTTVTIRDGTLTVTASARR
jgi:hypothetical protein